MVADPSFSPNPSVGACGLRLWSEGRKQVELLCKLNKQKKDFRQIFILRCHGEEQKRIAKILDISKRTVESRVNQIRKILSLPNLVDWMRALTIVELLRGTKIDYLDDSTWPQPDWLEGPQDDSLILEQRLTAALEEKKMFFELLNSSETPKRLRRVVLLQVAGFPQKQIASKLDIGLRTAEKYTFDIRKIFGDKGLDYWVSSLAIAELYLGKKIDAEDEQSWPTSF